jgi:hypothetical protein
MNTSPAWLTRCRRFVRVSINWRPIIRTSASDSPPWNPAPSGTRMTGDRLPVSDAELAELLAQHHARLIATQRRNMAQADRQQRQRAQLLGVELPD